jgi:hypothetical protein
MRGGRVRPGPLAEDSVTATLAGIWAFIRSDPASIRSLNTSGHWATWQETEITAGPRELQAPARPGYDRRSLRRRRSLV